MFETLESLEHLENLSLDIFKSEINKIFILFTFYFIYNFHKIFTNRIVIDVNAKRNILK